MSFQPFVQSDRADQRLRVGELSLTINGQSMTALFDRQLPGNEGLSLHLALLGNGMETQVGRGENRGKHLLEDFLVLSHSRYLAIDGKALGWRMRQ
ncbi:hypothetical protein K0I73_01280 [Shewanella mesophila]|uniref:hypothetical protein n=1 Tax=Shewanella mesophila TaxID=2864208 RepID=UPI001C656CA4|nr:hypothetical protein [Shewanella mesophila]QYJ86426.1 hypothetical protein K0I73_01280 [Shewanella mesophila]